MKNLYEYNCKEIKLFVVPEKDVVRVTVIEGSKEFSFILDRIQITRILEQWKLTKELICSIDVQSDEGSIGFKVKGGPIVDVCIADSIYIPMLHREFFTLLHLCDDYMKEYSIAQITRKMVFDDFALTIAQLGVHFGCGGADSILKKL